MRHLLPVPLLLAILASSTGCQDTSTSAADASAAAPSAATEGEASAWADHGEGCPLLGIPTTVRYEIQSGAERQYRVHLVNTADAPVAADCQHQQPLPGNVVMRYRLANRA